VTIETINGKDYLCGYLLLEIPVEQVTNELYFDFK